MGAQCRETPGNIAVFQRLVNRGAPTARSRRQAKGEVSKPRSRDLCSLTTLRGRVNIDQGSGQPRVMPEEGRQQNKYLFLKWITQKSDYETRI